MKSLDKLHRELIPYDEALSLLLSSVNRLLPAEKVSLLEAESRVLREDIKAGINIPPFSKSAMDGYAVRAEDTKGARPDQPVLLQVIEDLPAGKLPRKALAPGQATRIMTGGVLPKASNAVVMVENTQSEEGKKEVKIFREVKTGENIGLPGEDVKKGEIVIKRGTRLGPAQVGMIAALGRDQVLVSRRPVVAILSTGNEVQKPGAKLRPGQIYDANGFSLTAMAKRHGAIVKFLGIVRDQPKKLESKLRQAMKAEVVVLTGGVSVGDYDFTPELFASLGIREIFYKAKIQPGKPTLAGRHGRTLYFGLPGNPVSCLVCFELFVRPALEKLMGQEPVGMPRAQARLVSEAKIRPGRRKFLRAKLQNRGPELWVELFRDQKSGILRSLVESDVLVDVPAEASLLQAGQVVDILWPGR